MPRVIDCPTEEKLELAELVEMLETGDFDSRDEDNFASWGIQLKKLANDRNFLGDIMIAELKQRCEGNLRDSDYNAQVVMLHGRSQKFVMRANFWPAMKDSVVRHSGTDPFFYHIPHDHNFSFLTVGYLGPGYWSEYYEYDFGSVAGVPGEKVDLRFIEKARLDPGKVMLYRAHRDVHNQLPADDMSVSINIMHATPCLPFLNQYRFDVKTCEIVSILNRSPTEALLALAANHDGGNARDLVEGFAAGHPCDRIRFAAIRELAAAGKDVDAACERLGQSRHSANAFVAAMSAHELARLQALRHWIER